MGERLEQNWPNRPVRSDAERSHLTGTTTTVSDMAISSVTPSVS
jgi:hypothetical protein